MFRGSRGASDARFSKVVAASTRLARDDASIRRRGPRRHRRARARATRRGATPHARRVTLSRPLGGVRGHRVRVQRGRRVRRRRASHAKMRRVRRFASGAHPRGNRRGETRVRLGGRARPRVPTARRDTQTVGADRAAGAVHDPGGRGDATGRAAAFAALVRAMATRRVVAVVAFARVGERDAGARCAALVPAETEDGALHGLHVVYLPFMDDVRYPERAHDARTRTRRREDDDADADARSFDGVVDPRGATEAQIRAAEQAVDALAVHSYDPSDISNPALARHHRALESQALTARGPRTTTSRVTRQNRRGRTNSPPWARANPWRRSRRRRTARITTRRWRRRWRRRARRNQTESRGGRRFWRRRRRL